MHQILKMIKEVRHTAIVVRNLQKTKKFYCSLGFKKVSQAIEEGQFIDMVVGLKNVKLEWVKLRSPDGYLLELLEYYSHPSIEKIKKQKSNKLGCSHIAFTVDNIDEFCHQIIQLGGSTVNPPAQTNQNDVKVAYCHDNEGNLIEVVETL